MIFNKETGRVAKEEFFGIACYEGSFSKDGIFNGTHQGVLGDSEQAERWIFGDNDVPLIKIYDEGKREKVERGEL